MKLNNIKKIVTIGLSATFLLLGCSNATTEIIPYTETKFFFDTLITVTIYEDRQDVLDKAMELCEDYQARLSLDEIDSEIKMVNESQGEPIQVSDDLITIIETGIEYGELTNGAFDITIKPLAKLWGIGSDNENVPNDQELQDAIEYVNYENIIINGNEVQLSTPETQIDLGSISKGYIADQLKELLLSEGIDSGIINLGGNIQTIGTKPDGSEFEIGIQKPFGTNTESITSVSVNNKCVVTAGVYQRYFKNNDNIYHHILDTNTGTPISNGLWSVTIIAESSILADTLSTVCFIMGLDEGMSYINSLDGVDAIFITDELEVIKTF